MMDNLEKQIQEIELELDRFRKSEKRLQQLKEQLKYEKNKLEALDKKVEKEYQDIVELKKKSILDIFVDMQEEKGKKLEKEQEEYHKVLLKFKKQEKSIEAIRFEMGILKEKLKKLPETKNELARLLQKRPPVPLDPKTKSKLKKLEISTISKNKVRQSVHRAIASIKNQQVLLAEIGNSLKKIGTWGLWELPPRQKNQIFRQEFGHIFKTFDDQYIEMSNYKSELEHLRSLEKSISPEFQTGFGRLEADWQKLERVIEFFAEQIMTSRFSAWAFRQQLVQISAKVKSIDYDMEQEALSLKRKESGLDSKLKNLLTLKRQLLKGH